MTNVNTCKSSLQRTIRAQVLEQFPYLVDCIEQILPKKETVKLVKWSVCCWNKSLSRFVVFTINFISLSAITFVTFTSLVWYYFCALIHNLILATPGKKGKKGFVQRKFFF